MAGAPAGRDRCAGLRREARRRDHPRAGGRGRQPGAGSGRGHRGRRARHPRRAGRPGRPDGRLAGQAGAPRGPGAARGRCQHRIRALLPRRAASRGRGGAGQPRLHRRRTRAPGGRLRRSAGFHRSRARAAAGRAGLPGIRAAGDSRRPGTARTDQASHRDRTRAGRYGAARVHLRHDRQAQGGTADPPAGGGLHSRGDGGLAMACRRRARARAAVVPPARPGRAAHRADRRRHRTHPAEVLGGRPGAGSR